MGDKEAAVKYDTGISVTWSYKDPEAVESHDHPSPETAHTIRII